MRQANNATFWDKISQLSANLFHLASSVFSIPFQFLQQLYINVRLKILHKVQPTHQYIMKPTYNYQQERDHALQELISCYGEKHPNFFNVRQISTKFKKKTNIKNKKRQKRMNNTWNRKLKLSFPKKQKEYAKN